MIELILSALLLLLSPSEKANSRFDGTKPSLNQNKPVRTSNTTTTSTTSDSTATNFGGSGTWDPNN